MRERTNPLEPILEISGSVGDPRVRALLTSFFGEEGLKVRGRPFSSLFASSPLSTMKGLEGEGKLLEHTLRVTRSALAVAPIYGVKGFELDLLAAACLLHDAGKVLCYGKDERGRTVLSEEGLLDHVVLGLNLVAAQASRLGLPLELLNLLSHAISCHHHLTGRPKPEPRTLPASILASVDALDSLALSLDRGGSNPASLIARLLDQDQVPQASGEPQGLLELR